MRLSPPFRGHILRRILSVTLPLFLFISVSPLMTQKAYAVSFNYTYDDLIIWTIGSQAIISDSSVSPSIRYFALTYANNPSGSNWEIRVDFYNVDGSETITTLASTLVSAPILNCGGAGANAPTHVFPLIAQFNSTHAVAKLICYSPSSPGNQNSEISTQAMLIRVSTQSNSAEWNAELQTSISTSTTSIIDIMVSGPGQLSTGVNRDYFFVFVNEASVSAPLRRSFIATIVDSISDVAQSSTIASTQALLTDSCAANCGNTNGLRIKPEVVSLGFNTETSDEFYGVIYGRSVDEVTDIDTTGGDQYALTFRWVITTNTISNTNIIVVSSTDEPLVITSQITNNLGSLQNLNPYFHLSGDSHSVDSDNWIGQLPYRWNTAGNPQISSFRQNELDIDTTTSNCTSASCNPSVSKTGQRSIFYTLSDIRQVIGAVGNPGSTEKHFWLETGGNTVESVTRSGTTASYNTGIGNSPPMYIWGNSAIFLFSPAAAGLSFTLYSVTQVITPTPGITPSGVSLFLSIAPNTFTIDTNSGFQNALIKISAFLNTSPLIGQQAILATNSTVWGASGGNFVDITSLTTEADGTVNVTTAFDYRFNPVTAFYAHTIDGAVVSNTVNVLITFCTGEACAGLGGETIQASVSPEFVTQRGFTVSFTGLILFSGQITDQSKGIPVDLMTNSSLITGDPSGTFWAIKQGYTDNSGLVVITLQDQEWANVAFTNGTYYFRLRDGTKFVLSNVVNFTVGIFAGPPQAAEDIQESANQDAIGYIIPLFFVLIPAISLAYYMGAFGGLAGILIGVILGHIAMPDKFPLWAIALISIALAVILLKGGREVVFNRGGGTPANG